MTPTNMQKKTSSTSYGAKTLRWLGDYAEDVLIISGLGFIVWASFLVGRILGLYVLGVVLVGLGWFLARSPTGGR